MPRGDVKARPFAEARLAKAEQFLRSAAGAQERGDWDAAVSDAVLAGIAAADVYLSVRHSIRPGTSHQEAVQAIRKHGGPAVATQTEALRRLLSAKSASRYGEKMFGARECREAVVRAERLVGWARDIMKGA